jgi:TalC/MipB family fructose-6-phosphate aldolase
MKIYLDTADAAQIERLLATKLFSGVTSNPAILKAAGLGPSTAQKLYTCAIAAGAKEVFLQTFGQSVNEQVQQALRYRAFGPEVVIKVVSTAVGATVCAKLEQQGVPVLLTAVHDAKQTITAMAAGATYVTPYLSEIYRAGRDGWEQVVKMQRILCAAETKTRLLMAGFHDIATLVKIAEEGVRFATMTPDIADALFAQEQTEAMESYFGHLSAE